MLSRSGHAWRNRAIALLSGGLLSACSLFTQNIAHKPLGFTEEHGLVASTAPWVPAQADSLAATLPARKIAIFFDGTANDEGSDTNVKRLHSLVSLQDRGDIATLYVVGVGDGFDGLGKVTGAGINARVMLGYEFVLNHYETAKPGRPADEIYIFGFSRGAFAARILATMLHYAGIVTEDPSSGPLRNLTPQQLSKAVHEATFPGFGQGDALPPGLRRQALRKALKEQHLVQQSSGYPNNAIPVKALGLWDTVEALGGHNPFEGLSISLSTTPPEVNVDEPNKRYGERLCNVENAFHALSIDDDRATVFTPLLLSRKHLFDGCEPDFGMFDHEGRIPKGRLQEVWFAGAHSDVGGGYASGTLSGVSLNWMVDRLKCSGLLPSELCMKASPVRVVRADALGGSHDPIHGIFKYPRVHRDLVTFASAPKSIWRGAAKGPASLCVHSSVFERRSLIDPEPHESDQLLLQKPGPVQLTQGSYRMGRPWPWLRERLSPAEKVEDLTIDAQAYPSCDFMQEALQVLKTGKEKS